MGIGDVRPSHESRSPIEPERDRGRDRDRDRDHVVTRVEEMGSSFSMELAEGEGRCWWEGRRKRRRSSRRRRRRRKWKGWC
jgi:hypothetical protein